MSNWTTRRRKNDEAEEIREVIMAEKFPKIMMETKTPQIQEAHRILKGF